MEKQKHILIFRLSAMGDVAMTVPVVQKLALKYATCKITIVSRPFFAPFFKDIPNVTFFGVDLNNKHKGFLGIIRLFFDLNNLKITHVADFHNVLRSKIICFLFWITFKKVAKTNKARAEKKALTRAENKIFKPLTPIFERHIETLNKLGFNINLNNPTFGKTKKLPEIILANQPDFILFKNIGIAPFAQYESKVYPTDLMKKVIAELANNSKNYIYLFGGGEKEIEQLNKLKQNFANVFVVAGKLNLVEEMALIQNLNVMLSMDSGNGHIAAFLGINVVTLWGATHPFAGFMPFNQPFENAILASRFEFPLLPTSIYGNKKIVGYENAMRSIDSKSVVEKVNSLI